MSRKLAAEFYRDTATEHGETAALLERVELSCARWPELVLMFHPANEGARSKAAAGKLKAQRDAGRCKWVSIGAIWERLRSDWLFAGRDSEGYKLNNNYRSRYARLLIADFPEFAEIIETRELQSK